MANTQDLLGALLRRGMTGSSTRRVEHSLSESGGLAEILQQQLGIAPSTATAASKAQVSEGSSPLDALGSLGDIAKSFLGEGSQGKSLAAGGLGALLGAMMGGGGKAAKGAIGGGALALLGSIALKALQSSSQEKAQPDATARLAAGLREPENVQEQQEVQSVADLTVKAMVNAARADGRIDEDEMQKIVGELQEDGISQEERDYLLKVVREPANIDQVVAAVSSRQVAAQIYAASLLAIEVDTPAEKAYMQNLAHKLDLDAQVTSQLHRILGVA